jgi:[acyl-carrier-protein] S-malonyltransferase
MNSANADTIFLFPGQGSQYAGMALDICAALRRAEELFALASEAAGRDMKKTIAESGAEELGRTDIAQVAVTLANLCAAAALAERGIRPRAAAGHSLGEYAALAVCGVIGEEDCLRLVTKRGELMRQAAENAGDAGMAAVIGLPPETVEELIEKWAADGLCGLYAANFNSPRQTVVSGTAAALGEAETRFKEAGARRVIRLRVQGPFHSPFMEEAARAFAAVLEGVVFNDPVIPFFSNVTGGELKSGAEIKALAVKQIVSPVRWIQEETALAAQGASRILEAGPGTVLSGLWKDSGSPVSCLAAGTWEAVLGLAVERPEAKRSEPGL